MLVRALLVWLLLVLVAIANGALREYGFRPYWGAATGHVVSTLLLAVLIVLIAWLTIGWIAPATPRQAVALGAGWLALTIAFEFGFGRWRGKGWDELLADYDVTRGRIWLLVLLATVLAPWIAGRLRHMWNGMAT